MPNIEEISTAKEAATPGWAYVLDTGADPSKQAIVPTGARKRARVNYVDERAVPATAPGEVSSKEQQRINRRLADLEKENHRDVKIEIPGKPKDVAQWGLRPGKMTPGVKKILGSQKTWANYLDDEEARLAQLQQSGSHRQHTHDPSKLILVDKAKRLSGPAAGNKGKRGSTAAPSVEPNPDGMDVDPTPEPSGSMTTVKGEAELAAAELPPDIRQLIETDTPKMPSEDEIEALLSAPHLSYNQARATATTATAPPRQFCDICGFWGRAPCRKCGVRVCGLECLRAHQDTRCQKFYG